MEDHKEHAPCTLLYETVFELKEADFKLDVTRWVPWSPQSVQKFQLSKSKLSYVSSKFVLQNYTS